MRPPANLIPAVLFIGLLAGELSAQARIDMALYVTNSPSCNRLEIRLRPTENLIPPPNRNYSAGVFTVRFPSALGGTLSTVSSPYGYSISVTGLNVGGYNYYAFSFAQTNFVSWTAGVEYVAAVLQYSGGPATGGFELVTGVPWTIANNAEFYQELQGEERQGVIYPATDGSPAVPVVSASPSQICSGSSSTLSIVSGNLNGAANWQWYAGSCGGTPVGSGASIIVSPVQTTTYYVRGEGGAGGCQAQGGCAEVTVTVAGVEPITGTVTYTGCSGDGYSIMVGNTVYNESNPNGTETLTAASGCDSIVTIALTFLPNLTGTVTYTGCSGDGYSIMVGNTVYNESNPNGTETLTAANGCDSTVTIALTFLPNASSEINYTGFQGDGFEVLVNQTLYNEANPTGTEVLTAENGCDSVVTINLTFLSTYHFALFQPCRCSYRTSADERRTFLETVNVGGGPNADIRLPAGMVWTVTHIMPSGADAPIGMDTGAVLVYDSISGFYTISFYTIEDVAYQITIEAIVGIGGMPDTVQLIVSNTCSGEGLYAPLLTFSGSNPIEIPACVVNPEAVVRLTIDGMCNEPVNWNNTTFSVANAATFNILSTATHWREYTLSFPGAGQYEIQASFEDTFGEVYTLTAMLHVIPLDSLAIEDVIFPPSPQVIACDADNYPLDANGNPHPSYTGYPSVETASDTVALNPAYSNLQASYTDGPSVEVCTGAFEFQRVWTILNSCVPDTLFTWIQVIRIGDFTAPMVTCPASDTNMTYPTTPLGCTASFEAPLPQVMDACAASWTILTEILTDVQVPILDPNGQQIGSITQTEVLRTILPGESRLLTGIPLGNHRFRYTVTDGCGNVASAECPFSVIDLSPPQAVCNPQLNVLLNGNGVARILADTVNGGSSDNCALALIEVRRSINRNADCAPIAETFSAWGGFVDFSCCDAGRMVRIEMRVRDVGGNESICWKEVLVEDRVRPFCTAPGNRNVNCNALPPNFSPTDLVQLRNLFGEPAAEDNCLATVEELAPVVNLHECGWGTIIRRFRATDAFGNVSANQCQQIVTINEVHHYDIRFPKDSETTCGGTAQDTILFSAIACDLLSVSVQNDTIPASANECYRISRTFRVINWCEYDGQSNPVIVGRDEDCDNNPGDEHIWVLLRPNGVTYYDRDNAETNNTPAAFSRPTSCDGQTNPAGHWTNSNQKPSIASRGYWQYTQYIKVYDDATPAISVTPYDPFCSFDSPTPADPLCEGPVSIFFRVEERCTPNNMTVEVFLDAFNDSTFPYDYSVRLHPDGALSGDTAVFRISGSYPDYSISSAGLPIGRHKFEIRAADGCGNTTMANAVFDVVDCKAPAPICAGGLAYVLSPVDTDGDGIPDAGMATVWATDLISSPVTDCTPPIIYSIRRAGQMPDINRATIFFNCDDYPPGAGTSGAPHVIYVDAWDGLGNRDFCETFVLIQDPEGVCAPPPVGFIAGTIRTEQAQPIEGVHVVLSGPMTRATQTPNAGTYSFSGLQAGFDYTITPLLDSNYLNGVTTFDLVMIQRHILAVQPLDSPYKMIAADANNSKTITTVDIITLRRLILALIDDLPDNTSWRFVPSGYVFPVPTNPWFEPFPETIRVNDLDGVVLGRDFVGVKIGDVNGSALPNLDTVEDHNGVKAVRKVQLKE